MSVSRHATVRAAKRAIKVAALLERRGCEILAAHAHGARPRLHISEPPAGLIDTFAVCAPVGLRAAPLAYATWRDVQLEWEVTR